MNAPAVEGIIDPRDALPFVTPYARRTPLLTSRLLCEETGLNVRLKAEVFQRTGSYKLRGPLHKLALLSPEDAARGVICSSAGNHAQGVALAAAIHGIKATVVMATNATPSKVQATRDYGADVVLHGQIWDEADQHARRLVDERGFTYVHPFDDFQLIAGQGTLGLEIDEDCPGLDAVIVPIGGGGLISGVATAFKLAGRATRIIGVESAGAPAMKLSVERGERVTLDDVATGIDGLRVKRVGERNLAIVETFVDELVAVPDEEIFDALLWLMTRAKVVCEGAAAASVAALRGGHVSLPEGATVACVLSGGNLDLSRLAGQEWN